jgi:hypothetical protein
MVSHPLPPRAVAGLLLALAAALLGALLAAPAPALIVAEPVTGRTLVCLPVRPAPVVLRYRHSLYDALTTEEFAVEGERLVLRRLSSERLAALEYYGRAEPPVPVSEGYAISGLAEPHQALPLLVGPVGERTLVYGPTVVPLWRLAAAGGQVEVRIGQAPRAVLLWRDLTG